MIPGLADPTASAAVLIGGTTYLDARIGEPLPSVANNLADLRALLTDVTIWGLPEGRCRVLVDRTDPNDLMESLDELARTARDTLVVYYAGHGMVTRDGDLVLPTRSTLASLPKYTALPYSHIREIVGSSRAERRIVVLDCCFSGRALHAMSDITSTIVGQMDAEGTFIMTSAPATSVSLAPAGARHTAFTGELLEILGNGIPGLDELLCLDEVYEHVLTAMVRRGLPRPQRLGTNNVGRFGFLGNRAWLKGWKARVRRGTQAAQPPSPSSPEPSPARAGTASLTRYRQLADGVHAAVAVVSPALGLTGLDGLSALQHAYPNAPAGLPTTTEQEGIALVRETMLAMRAQYGDGATTAAVILGALVDGLWSLLSNGTEPSDLDRGIIAGTTWLTAQLAPAPGMAGSPSDAGVQMAIRDAVGDHDAVEAVLTALHAVGVRNVDVALSGADTADGTRSTFVLQTTVLAPNSAAGPIALEDPLIVVSPDGELDTRSLMAAGRQFRSGLLIIAPKVSIHVARSLLHSFTRMVVVRPATPGFDLAALRDRLSPDGGPGWSQARRVLVLADTTTIERPPTDLEFSRNRLTVTFATPESLAIASRALAVARSVADAGLIAGAGVGLYTAARSGDATTDAAMALVRTAACTPYRLLRRVLPDSPGQAVDPLATVRGALMHAAASASRYLASDLPQS